MEQHLRTDSVLVAPCVGERAVDVGWIQLVVTLHSEKNDEETLVQQPLFRTQHVEGYVLLRNTAKWACLGGSYALARGQRHLEA